MLVVFEIQIADNQKCEFLVTNKSLTLESKPLGEIKTESNHRTVLLTKTRCIEKLMMMNTCGGTEEKVTQTQTN